MTSDENFDIISSVDRVSFTLPKLYLQISKVIKVSLEDDPTATAIELHLSQHVLEPIITYMTECQGIDLVLTPKIIEHKHIEDIIDNSNILTLINTLGQNIKLLYEVINASNYLDIPGLLNLCSFKLASLIKDQPIKNISGILNGSHLDLKEDEYTTFCFEIDKKNIYIDILNDFKPTYIDQFLRDIYFYLVYPKFKMYTQDGNILHQLTDPGYLKYTLEKIISMYGEDFINWQLLSRNPSLTPQIIEDFKDKWEWEWLSRNPSLTPQIIEKFKHKWHWEELSRNTSLSSEIIEEFKKKWHWEELSRNTSLTPQIIEQFKDKWHWEELSRNPSLSSQIIEQFKKKWHWEWLSDNRSLTSQIIEQFKKKWDWQVLSQNPSLTPQIIEQFKHKWNWKVLSRNTSLTPQIIEKFKDKWEWEILSQNPSLTPQIIGDFKDKWNWEVLSANPSLTPQIIEDFKDKWNWQVLSHNPSLTPQIIQKFNDKWNWQWLSHNPSLTPQIIEEFKDKWDWQVLSRNLSLTPQIIEKFKDKWSQDSIPYKNVKYLDANIEDIPTDFIFYLMSSRYDVFKYLNDKIRTVNDKYRTDVCIHYLDDYLIPQLTTIVLNYT